MKLSVTVRTCLKSSVQVTLKTFISYNAVKYHCLDHALHLLRSMADQGDQQERDAATVLAAYIERAVRDQRRARMAGTRMLKAARRYRQAAKRMEAEYGQ